MPNLRLELLNPEKHIDHVMTWVNNPDVVKNFKRFDHVFTREEELGFLKALSNSPTDRVFSVFTLDGVYVGQVGLRQIDKETKSAGLSAFIKREFQNQGYGTTAICRVITYAWGVLHAEVQKIWLICYADNKKAQHVYGKIGFELVETIPGHYEWPKGVKHDVVRMEYANPARRGRPKK